MTNTRYGKGLILAITTPKSNKLKGEEVYYVQSERSPDKRYRVNFEDGTYECPDSIHRGEDLQAFLQSCNGEGDRLILYHIILNLRHRGSGVGFPVPQ